MTPQQFIRKWKRSQLSERSACHEHFLDLCELLGQPTPAEADPDGAEYTFERGVRKTGGGSGWADVWKRGCFGWEYKGRHRDLNAAYEQLLSYREALENPPLLVVCDMDRFQVHTNFTGTAKRVYEIDLTNLDEPANLDVLRKVFSDPEALHPARTAARITEETAALFGRLADVLRQRGVEPQRAAHFLMKIIFGFFAQDIGLLPEKLISRIIKMHRRDPHRLVQRFAALFEAMRGGGDFGVEIIPRFNGGLFADADVVALQPEDVDLLDTLAGYKWEHIEPSIFGTLYLRTLDPDKRSQIGAQYTSKADILTLVEPVLMAPLRRQWDEVRRKCDAAWEKVQQAVRGAHGRGRNHAGEKERRRHDALLQDFVESLSHVRVLDPACGSGNFLYVAIQLLLDLEKEVITYAAGRDLSLLPHVRPSQLYGIEVNTYAYELAQIVIWIGYLQWMRHNGFNAPSDPVLEPIHTITQMDAILIPGVVRRSAANRAAGDAESPTEPEWPETDVIVGNPPFLGGKLLRANLGDDYVDAMFHVWASRVPREADLCCYWFEKARAAIEKGRAKRAGLLATQGIRGGANREVLKRIKETGDIFFAISDRDWVLDGANVHVSMVGFDSGTDSMRTLDGQVISAITPNLGSTFDASIASRISANDGIYVRSPEKGGKFEISEDIAITMLRQPNPNGRSNVEVIRRWANAEDIAKGRYTQWIIDFHDIKTETEAAQFEAPYEYIKGKVYAFRQTNRYPELRQYWWRFRRSGDGVREAGRYLARLLCTPMVAKHRLFVWLDPSIQPDKTVPVFARDDDYFFSVLHSAVHERWSRRMGTQLREAESGCRYTPTTCFETFPFPPLSGGIAKDVPRSADFASAPDEYHAKNAAKLRQRIAEAAQKLHELRENWLNPSGAGPAAERRTTQDTPPSGELPGGGGTLDEQELKKRTLTNLYNDRPTWLELAHLELDRAILAAYGWPADWAEALQPKRDGRGRVNPILGVADPAIEQEVLARLLALNLSQGGK